MSALRQLILPYMDLLEFLLLVFFLFLFLVRRMKGSERSQHWWNDDLHTNQDRLIDVMAVNWSSKSSVQIPYTPMIFLVNEK